MEKTIFEQMGGTYTKVGDYYLPDLLPAEQEEQPISEEATSIEEVAANDESKTDAE